MKISGPVLDRNKPEIIAKLAAIAPRIAKKDPNIWGVKSEAATRLDWIDLPTRSRDLLPQLDALSAWARSNKLTHIVLCGMGGSSLAPEVIAATYKKELTVLDSTDPAQISNSIPKNLNEAVIVIASKSGGTIETQSQFKFYQKIFLDSNLNPTDHIVIITDPATVLDKSARSGGFRVINADPNVGGRFSALSAFGLVPAALVGVDISILLDDAEKASRKFLSEDSPAISIAAALFSATDQIISFCDKNSNTPGLSDWIEQLVAESTGKDQTGRLPVVIDEPAKEHTGLSVGFVKGDFDLVVEASLGEQFILWEWVTALLCHLLDVDPFNQPNVTEAKDRTAKILSDLDKGNFIIPKPTYEDADLAIYSNTSVKSLTDFVKTPATYFAVMAYLTRGSDDEIAKLQPLIFSKSKRATTFGWGPRFLHSTGQFHKGGQQNGAFIQITGESKGDIKIPGENYSFSQLIMAQALGDAAALSERNLPLIRIHLKNRKEGIAKLLAEIKKN